MWPDGQRGRLSATSARSVHASTEECGTTTQSFTSRPFPVGSNRDAPGNWSAATCSGVSLTSLNTIAPSRCKLVDGGQYPARGARVASGNACQDDVDEDGRGETEPEATDEQRQGEQPVSRIVAVLDDEPQEELRCRDRERAGDQQCSALLGGQRDAEAGGDDRAERVREDHQAGLPRGPAGSVLEVDRQGHAGPRERRVLRGVGRPAVNLPVLIKLPDSSLSRCPNDSALADSAGQKRVSRTRSGR